MALDEVKPTVESGENYDSEKEFKYVGTRPDRPDGLDKVTGRAKYGADMYAPNMLHAAVLRSPHAHARIVSIDTSKAEAAEGVKAVVIGTDLPEGLKGGDLHLQENTLARDKVYYDGHAVAAVAATSALAAKDAVKLIEVEYELLPHVIDVDEAMKPDAPVIRADAQDHSVPEGSPANVSAYMEFGHGDLEAGFAEADLVKEHTFKTEATHQGYIEPHACLGQLGEDGKGEMWVCTQGHWFIRKMCGCSGAGGLATSCDGVGNRRWIWRQDHHLLGSDFAGIVPQGWWSSGQAGDDAFGGAAGDWSDSIDFDGRENRHEERWHYDSGQR